MGRPVSVEDYRLTAKRRLPKMIFDFVDGGAGHEGTMRSNVAAFDRVVLRPRSLVDVSRRSTATTVLGESLSLPVILAPTGLQRLVHRHGELKAAAAAGQAGTAYIASTASGFSLEEIASAAQGPLWFQLYLWRDRALVESLVRRAAAAGYTVLVVTVDVPQVGLRLRDMRNGMSIPPKVTLRNLYEGARHPRWVRELFAGPQITFKNIVDTDFARGVNGMSLMAHANRELTNPTTTWDELRWLKQAWPGKIVVKGLLTAEDAAAAVDAGADGVVVSNHGGRQLDGGPATLDVLPEVVAAVGDRCEVLLDGGVRQGADVVKAIALGARAVLIGRPYWWGLAVNGQQGVLDIIEMLRSELDNVLAQIGRPTIDSIDASAIGPSASSAEGALIRLA